MTAAEQDELERLRRANARLAAELARRQQESAARDIGQGALKASERRLRDTLESIDAGFLLIDRDWSVIDMNQRAAQMVGRPASRIVARSVFQIWPNVLGAEFEAMLRQAMLDRQRTALLHRYAAGGEDRCLDLRVFAAAQGLTLFFRDVTEQEQARQRLHQAETSARLAIQAARLGTWSYEPQTGRLTWDARHRALFGISPDASVGLRTLLDGIHPDDRARVEAAVAAACDPAGSGEVVQEYRSIDATDGRERWLAAMGQAQFENGACTRVDGVVQDVTERRRDRDALERLVSERTATLAETLARLGAEEARLRAIFQHSSECLFLFRVDPARGPVFLDVNPPAAMVLGCDRSDAVGRTPREVSVDPVSAADTEANLAAALRPGAGPHRYLAHRRYAGQERVLDAVAVALDGPGGERLLLVTARDITEQRALEEALRQSHKMEAVGQLTGGIAHDFNNLLTGISGGLELIRTRAAQGRFAEIDRYAEAALESVRRGAALTHRLLAFARRQALAPRPVDLNRLVADMDELIRRTAGPGIAFETVLEPGLWRVLCDANQLENALLNLCLNARDAMPQGGTLRITTANVADDGAGGGDAVAVSASDSGAGMAPEVAARAFEPFFTTKPLGQGTGLGLAMVYGFVRQSGGHASLRSEPGRGTTVRIVLPRFLGASPAADPAPAGPPTAATPPPPSQVILLVEDEPLVRELAAEALGGLGYEVLEACDAASALRLLERGTAVDLLLTDVGLPGMNGRQLVEAARAWRPGLKVLFVTGYAHEAGGEVGLIGPGMALLGKPFGLAALARKVEAVLAG